MDTDKLKAALREHDDPRLYHEADVLMSQAADRIEELERKLTEAERRQVPEGWKLVPIEPDARQVARGEFAMLHPDEYPAGSDVRELQVIDVYRDMVAAAPEKPE